MALQTPPNSTGAVIDTVQATVGKERQIAAFGDPTTGTNVASVSPLANSTLTPAQVGVLVAAPPAGWSAKSTPASATLATATIAAGAAGVQHVCRTISFTLAVDGTHAQTAIQLNLRDGVSGAGTILWSITLLKAATEAISMHHFAELHIPGSAATAMTLEFSAAGVTGSVESLSFTGYDI